jgi:hypothetical protein
MVFTTTKHRNEETPLVSIEAWWMMPGTAGHRRGRSLGIEP